MRRPGAVRGGCTEAPSKPEHDGRSAAAGGTCPAAPSPAGGARERAAQRPARRGRAPGGVGPPLSRERAQPQPNLNSTP
jgi:hypothetical protein